jgi:type IV secretion/conjugal transfer VirB4 family ATPase
MMLKKHLSDDQGLSDLLNYAHFVDEGVIINKDGAFLVCYKFRGPDINSASGGELDGMTSNFNRMATFLEDGWMIHIDELRVPSLTYPGEGCFPDKVSILIDEERRQMYESEGVHYENFQFITFVWKFPLPVVKATRHWFVDGVSKNEDDQNLSKLLKHFHEIVERCVGMISTHFVLEKLGNVDLLSYLNTCITGELLPVSIPPDGCFIDVVLGRRNVIGGYVPQIGKNHIYILSIVGYLNEETIPGLLEEMGTYPLIYRWSNRFISLSEATAEREIKRYQKNWNNKVKGFVGIVKEVISGKPSNKVNYDALQMSHQTDEALTANSNRTTRFGYWTSEIVLMNENLDLLEQATKDLTRYLEQSGFACIKEDVNAFDAWLGTIPGHGSCNVRRVFINSINLAHVLPLNTIWAGTPFSSSSSLLPHKSPPVFYAATTGKTPFRFHMDVADVGHQVVLGPTGAGKSTYLGFLIAQFLRYKDAQIFVFDKDYSHKALTFALDGYHYDIGEASELAFCPLSDLSTETKKVRAEQFIENLVYLQNVPITPDIRAAIHTAIESLSSDIHAQSRNLTVFRSEVQHDVIRSAIQYYTIDGQIKLLDATRSTIQLGYLQTFEMNWLLSQKPEIYLPVLGHIFDQIESRLEESNGKKPTLIVLEEAWLYISHEVFAKKLKDWLKTLRKKNARVVFATQSLADLYDPSTKSLTGTTAAIMESCPTKVYLPNPSMEAEIKELYRKMGLSDRQLEIISHIGIPKRHYYIVTPEGNRLIDLGFSDIKPITLAFIGLSKDKSNALIECKTEYGNEWIYYWLTQNGFDEWANFWRKNYFERGAQ